MTDIKKVSYYDLKNLHPGEIKQKYRINDRQLEQSVRRHLDGANSSEKKQFYNEVYDSRNKR